MELDGCDLTNHEPKLWGPAWPIGQLGGLKHFYRKTKDTRSTVSKKKKKKIGQKRTKAGRVKN